MAPRARHLLTVAPLALIACTTSDLVAVLDRPVFERQQIRARLCAPEARLEDVPYRILFVIDTSLSNRWNDPDGRREEAVRNAITSLSDEENVRFGIITYSDEPRRQTFGFTRDLDILDGATANVGNAQGGTNFSDTLWAVIDFINDDIETLTVAEATRTHYLVFWLSDGFPTVGVIDQAALLPAIEYLLDQVEHRVAEIRFNTMFLGSNDPLEEEDATAAEDLLRSLAEIGNGSFTSIPAGESFEFDVDRNPVLSPYRFAYAVASNHNVVFGKEGPRVDSDGDGVSDALEISYGLDPAADDTDGDGFRDGVEVYAASRLQPSAFDPGCELGTGDLDQDGLRDCEEAIVGTLAHTPDSDGDFLPDPQELFAGTSPVIDDTTNDDDLDNISNQDELRFHLDPLLPNTAEELELWGYAYEVEETVPEQIGAPPCYEIVVRNITMSETLDRGENTRGVNRIDLLVAFQGTGVMRFFQAGLVGRVIFELNLWQPADGRFALEEDDFLELE